MVQQIYSKEFFGSRNTFYDPEDEARRDALVEANTFFIKHNDVDIVNVVEYWNEDKSHIRIIVYYKDYI